MRQLARHRIVFANLLCCDFQHNTLSNLRCSWSIFLVLLLCHFDVTLWYDVWPIMGCDSIIKAPTQYGFCHDRIRIHNGTSRDWSVEVHRRVTESRQPTVQANLQYIWYNHPLYKGLLLAHLDPELQDTALHLTQPSGALILVQECKLISIPGRSLNTAPSVCGLSCFGAVLQLGAASSTVVVEVSIVTLLHLFCSPTAKYWCALHKPNYTLYVHNYSHLSPG